MAILRHHFRQHRWLAFVVVGLALLMRIAVPAGYMPAFAGKTATVALCSGSGPMTMAMPGVGDHRDTTGDHHKSETPCGFASLSTPSLAGTDPVVLAMAIAFILATAFRAVPPGPVAMPTFLRPPPTGPPATA